MRPAYPITRLDYALPPELIAQQPLPDRTASRLLHVRVADGSISDRRFAELPQLLPPRTLLVLNDSRVLPARVHGTRRSGAPGQGGGRVEVLYLRYLADGVCEAVVGSNARLQAGEAIALPAGWSCELRAPKSLEGSAVRYITPAGSPATLPELLAYLEAQGQPPLPPYIKRGVPRETDIYDATNDKQRYQTVYAQQDGSAAAPTAGLHFDAALLAQLEREDHTLARVTLHVGLGTFAPVRVDDLRDHVMHEEAYSVTPETAAAYQHQLQAGLSVLAVGTTSLRVLHTILGQGGCRGEAMLRPEPFDQGEAMLRPDLQAALVARPSVAAMCLAGSDAHPTRAKHGFAPTNTSPSADTAVRPTEIAGMTDAFIYPGHGTQACDMLLTNFHLPRSTLLALVYAFGGEELLRQAYEHAVAQRYRFFSYGDCMLIDRRRPLN